MLSDLSLVQILTVAGTALGIMSLMGIAGAMGYIAGRRGSVR